jgi:CubicO group peptidase (beta-lactamase class C family)
MRRHALLSLSLAATLSYAAPAFAVDRWDSDYAPSSLAVHLASLKAAKVDVREIGFTANGQWIAVSANGVATSSAPLFDVGTFGLRDALVKAHTQRLVVTALAIRADGHWMFVASNQLFTSSVAPESNLVRAALARGLTVTSLSFGPNRRFAMVAGGEITVQPSSPEIERARRAALASGMKVISFDQAIDRDEWAIRAGHDAWVYPFSSALTTRAVDYQRENDRMSLIAFVPGRGYLVASNEKHLRDLTDIATDFERTFTTNATLWKRMSDLGVVALGYAILDDGKIRFARGYGETRKGRADSRRVDPESQFQAASMSKFVASVGVVRQAPELLNRTVRTQVALSPGSTLATWASRFDRCRRTPGASCEMSERLESITMRSLLSHTAGISLSGIGTRAAGVPENLGTVLAGTGQRVVEPSSPPNVSASYSGGGFSVAEAMLEAYTGARASEALRTSVLVPAGMLDSTFDLPATPPNDWVGTYAAGPTYVGYSFCPGRMAGGLFTTPRDYAKLLLEVDGSTGNLPNAPSTFLTSTQVYRLFRPSMSAPAPQAAACSKPADCGVRDRCEAGKCVTPLRSPQGDTAYYALGVGVSSTLNLPHDALPSSISHGGTQPGVKSHFIYDRTKRRGYVVFLHGAPDEAKLETMRSEVIAAMKRVLGL